MKIVLTCGHAYSGYQQVHAILRASGIAEAIPSATRGLTPEAFLEKMYVAHDLPADSSLNKAQLDPGKLWQEIAADLFMANMSEAAWGWADSRNLWLLDFWAAFDAQTRFVLVYSSLEYVVGHALGKRQTTKQECEQVMQSWLTCNKEVLRFYNRHPGRCLLVNASASSHSPEKIVERVANEFGISLASPAGGFPHEGGDLSGVAACLARPLVEGFEEAAELFRELESTTDFDSSQTSCETIDVAAAWREYAGLLVRLDESTHAADVYLRQTTALQMDLEAMKLDRASAEEQAAGEQARLVQEIASLSTQVGDLQHTLQNTQVHMANALEEGQRRYQESLEERQRMFDESLQARQLALEEALSAPAKLRQENQELTQENELLLMQLHQMQDELMHLTTENQQLLDRLAQSEAVVEVPAYLPMYQLREVLVDMTADIDGDNWYYAEQDGRWAGPHNTSTIRVPALQAGTYDLCLDVVDAKAPEILAGMTVSLNDLPLDLRHEGEGVVAMVHSRFSSSRLQGMPVWEFTFRFPRLISPAEHGSDDFRILAVRLRSLRLTRVGGGANAAE